MEFVIFLAICVAIYMVFKRSSKNERPKQATQKGGRPKQAAARNDSSKWNHLLFADTETTGLGKKGQVVEVAVVDSRENVIFHRRIRPTVRISPDAEQVHGISEANLANAPKWDEVHDAFCKAIKGKTVVFYNAPFDKRLLQQTMDAYGLKTPEEISKSECAMQVMKQWTGKRVSLVAAAEGLDLDYAGNAHSAVGDAVTTCRVMRAVLH